jgi:galactose mutarotase-like enzyme
MQSIQNDQLRVNINSKGAELDSIFHKTHQLEYLWNGDAAFWGKKSPVLFPIIGTLKGNKYQYKGEIYQLSRHGFAREHDFETKQISETEIEFLLKSDKETLKVYPFQFEFSLIYRLEAANLSVTYRIKNKSRQVLYASVGAHPAFKVPLQDGLHYDDYFLEFSEKENAGRYPINAEGLIISLANPCLQNTNRLPLTKQLFHQDALVFKDLRSDKVSLRSEKSPHGLRMTYKGFPFFGIWAAKDADFVCLEPWCGIADGEDAGQDITKKEGIMKAGVGKIVEKTWSVDFF